MTEGRFCKSYHIRSYECDCHGALRLITLMNMFQDIADSHASQLNIGIEHCLQNGLAWVGSNYHIRILRMPVWNETVKIITWPSAQKKISAIRDFRIENEQQNTLIKATSQWVLLNASTRRPVVLKDNLPEYKVVDENALASDFAKIDCSQTKDYQRNFAVKYDDIDVNGHVNNAVYPLWASESIHEDFRQKHSPQEIEIAFKKECFYGEKVLVDTGHTENLLTIHRICAESDGRELAQVRIRWNQLA